MQRGSRVLSSAYQFAAGLLVSDRPVPGLEALERPFPRKLSASEPFSDAVWTSEPTVHLRGPVSLGGGSPHLTYGSVDSTVDLLRFDGGTIAVARDGSRIEWDLSDRLSAVLQNTWIHGPALCLALARRGTFCLHASAVALPEGAMLFAGPSGAGKSTLASLLPFPRLSDDVIALPEVSGRPAVSPELGHLGLSLEDRRSVARQSSLLPLAAIYLLVPEEGSEVKSYALTPSKTLAFLGGQTVVHNLFDTALAGDLLDRWEELLGTVPVRGLAYPRIPSVGPAVLERIRADLASTGEPPKQPAA